MLNLRFSASLFTYQDVAKYCNDLATCFGMPRLDGGATGYAVPIQNLAGNAWAVDISNGQTPWPGDPDNATLFKTPSQLDALAIVPFPAGTTTFDLEASDPEWFDQGPVGP